MYFGCDYFGIDSLTGYKSWSNTIEIIEEKQDRNEYSTIDAFDDDRFHNVKAMGFVSVAATTTTAHPGK